MAAHDRYTDAGTRYAQVRQVHDLAALVLHLHLFARIALVLLAADLRDEVIGDLVREDLRLHGLAGAQCLDLLGQLHGAARACAGNSLIRRGDHGADRTDGVERVHGRDRDDRRAVRAGDDAVVQLHILGIDLRDDKRHIIVHAVGGRVVHKHRARAHDLRRVETGDVTLGSTEHDIEAAEVLLRRLLDHDGAAVPLHDLARAAAAGKQAQLRDRELTLRKNLHHFAADRTGRAENTDFIQFHGNNPPGAYLTNALYSTRIASA